MAPLDSRLLNDAAAVYVIYEARLGSTRAGPLTRTRVFERVIGPTRNAIIFTEALMHGALPWRGSDDRRRVFYKYSPRPLAWSRTFDDLTEHPGLTAQRRNILRSPGSSAWRR
jgi:hypothetical protein